MRWLDVDLDTDSTAPPFSIVQQLVRDNGRAVAPPPKSATSRRTLALDQDTAPVLPPNATSSAWALGTRAHVFHQQSR